MTNKTEIAELRERAKKVNHRLDGVMQALSPFNPDESAHWDCEKLIVDLIDQLEVKGARAEKAEAELAAILGAAVPVENERKAFNEWNNDFCQLAGRNSKDAAWLAWQRRAKLFTHPAPPVVVLQKYTRNQLGQVTIDGKSEPRIGFGEGWNSAVDAFNCTVKSADGEG